MNQTSNFQEAAASLLKEAHCDEIPFSEVLWRARKIEPTPCMEDAVVALIKVLLADPEIRVGQWDPAKRFQFDVWTGTQEEIIPRILREWQKFPGGLTPGDVAWFVTLDALDYIHSLPKCENE